MRNSAWYPKIWQKKLQEFPLGKDIDSAWADMKSILDKELPVAGPTTHPSLKTTISKLVSPILTYILPAAAMVTAAGYFMLKHPIEKDKIAEKKKQNWHVQKHNLNTPKGTLALVTDSISNKDTVYSKQASVTADLLIEPQVTGPTGDTTLHLLLKSEISATNVLSSGPLPFQSVLNDKIMAWTPLAIPSSLENKVHDRGLENKEKTIKFRRIRLSGKTERRDITTPPYNYELEIGINKNQNDKGFYIGASGSYALNKRWLISAGLQLNTSRQLSGEYSHPSYYRPDSLPAFKINDARKILTLDIPLLLEYKVSNSVSLRAGPFASLLLKQSNKLGLVAPMADMRDTVYHSKEINQAISKTSVNQINIGITGGVSYHFKQFDLNGKYQLLSPYKISNDLGSYKMTYHTFQIGLGYRFKP